MSPAPPSLTLDVLPAIAAIGAADWDGCAGSDNPFVSHAFLAALESSGSAGPATGWQPCHLAFRQADGRLAAVVPLYLKNHSMGEYVFDHAWAEASHRAGRPYYPKLQCAVPFSPVTGPRLLIAPDQDRAALIPVLARTMAALAGEIGASSVHVTFPTEAEAAELGSAGFLPRLGCQYHWDNPGYDGFEDFLARLSARKRKQIRKERAAIVARGIGVEVLSGADLTPSGWDEVHRLLSDTAQRKWGRPYLTRAFFEALSAPPLADRVVIIRAESQGRTLGIAWNMRGGDALYGRSWGGCADIPFLHFEVCYYRALDYAMTHRLARVEAGAQGEHKISRGYLPRLTHSAHWIADAGLSRAVANFLSHERPAVEAEARALMADSPFRQDGDPAAVID
jgi:predicted N-acyltransferase